MLDHLVLCQRESLSAEKLNVVVLPNCDVAPPSSCRITDGKLLEGGLDPVPPGEGAHLSQELCYRRYFVLHHAVYLYLFSRLPGLGG